MRSQGLDNFLNIFELLRREEAFFSLKLRYAGDTLVEAVRDGKPLPLEEDR